MRPRTDDEILEDLKDWPVRNIYVERGVKLIEQLRQRVQELEKERDELLKASAIAKPVMEAHSGPSRLADFLEAIDIK